MVRSLSTYYLNCSHYQPNQHLFSIDPKKVLLSSFFPALFFPDPELEPLQQQQLAQRQQERKIKGLLEQEKN